MSSYCTLLLRIEGVSEHVAAPSQELAIDFFGSHFRCGDGIEKYSDFILGDRGC